ncbi:MAG: polysaccharide pyruvyl transferase family protein [Peptoanaerobacter stomatis]|uniref:polysaccharide pyruvyl transferase family protein n=1 Tax=Peptoanaerobacter stomatis TaxID=796937 RepID=UPI003F9EFFEA
MDNIAILTYHNTSNFGAMLQTYGLYAFLYNSGYSCKILNYVSKAIDENENPQNLLCELKKKKSIITKLFILLTRRKRIKKYKDVQKFLLQNTSLTKKYNVFNLNLANHEFDTFLVGSDMVWNFTINKNDLTFLLDFADETKYKYSYASSLGEEWSDSINGDVIKLFNRFNNISIREEQFKLYLENKIKRNVDVVCDPTMLLTRNEWEKYTVSSIYKNYVLVYFDSSDSKCLNDAIKYANTNGYTVKYISLSIRKYKTHDTIWPTTIEQFLSLVKNAKAVFTASYHGLLFSVYFERELFWYSRAQNSRMKYISDKLGLDKRCGSDYNFSEMPEIDYFYVQKNLNEFRDYSINVLHSFLVRPK